MAFKNSRKIQEKIIFQNISSEDVKFLFQLYTSGKSLTHALSPEYNISKPEHLNHTIEHFKNASDEFLYIVKLEGKPIGIAMIYDTSTFNCRTKIGISLLDEYIRHGFGKEIINFLITTCIEEIQVKKVSTEIFEYNEHAIKFIEEMGFHLECKFLKHIKKENSFYDQLIYSYWPDY